MPKEITHWLIAGNAMEALESDSNLRKLLIKHKNYYLLGAVIYDTPYSFLGLTKKQKQFKKIADKLHGAQGEDAFCPFKNFFQKIYRNNLEESDEAALAFSLGFLTHVIIDLNFHPMIFYLTGNYYSKDKQERDRAVSNHRWLEANLDLWFLQEAKQIGQPIQYLKEVTKDIDAIQLSKILLGFVEAICLTDLEKKAKEFKTAVNYHAFFQQMFFVDWLRGILALLLGKEQKTVALFYPKAESVIGEKLIVYLHPITGFRHEISIGSLKQNTERKLVTVFKEVERILYREKSDQSLQNFISALPSLSIETGVARTSSADMTYFNERFDRSAWYSEE